MQTRMFLNLPAGERHAYVYRVVSLERLLELFSTGRNVLVSPELWDDPFENFILKGQRVSRHGWYGQCWTRQRASDAMWRIYSPDSNGVRMRSTPTRLLESLRAATEGDAFIGKVRYLPNGPLMRFARKALKRGYLTVAANGAHTLLVKRPAFRHESEVRLLVNRQSGFGGKLLKYEVDPHTLVDQLMLDPRLSPEEAAKAKTEIRSRTGYRGSIKRSLLYGPPPPLT